jgi:hypothetical protein
MRSASIESGTAVRRLGGAGTSRFGARAILLGVEKNLSKFLERSGDERLVALSTPSTYTKGSAR